MKYIIYDTFDNSYVRDSLIEFSHGRGNYGSSDRAHSNKLKIIRYFIKKRKIYYKGYFKIMSI
jgi:hypothetical protein